MPYSLKDKLVVAISSSALFDTSESHGVFRTEGVDAYKAHQREREDQPFGKGSAYPFVQRLLSFNRADEGFEPIEVVLLSRNSPDSGLRVMNSIRHYGLPISRAIFTGGRPPFGYAVPLGAVLYLSTNVNDVRAARQSDIPGGLIVGSFIAHSDTDDELRIAFDFDGILVDDTSEKVYRNKGLEAFHRHEAEHAAEPLSEGPLMRLLEKIAQIQKNEREKKKSDPDYRVRIRTAICTARNAPAHARPVHTLRDRGIEVDEIFFLGGIDKRDVLSVFRPHIFVDDQETWVESASRVTASVLVPLEDVERELDSRLNGRSE